MPRPFSASRYLTGLDPARDAWHQWMKEGGPLPSYPAADAFEDDELRAVLSFVDVTMHCEAPLTETGRTLQSSRSNHNRDQKEKSQETEAACLKILDIYFTIYPLTRKRAYTALTETVCVGPTWVKFVSIVNEGKEPSYKEVRELTIWDDFDPCTIKHRLRTKLLPKLLSEKFPKLGFKLPRKRRTPACRTPRQPGATRNRR